MITINNKTIGEFLFGSKKTNYNNISVTNGRVLIDGHDVTSEAKIVTIHVIGNVDKIEGGSADIHIQGNVNQVSTGSGDVEVSGTVEGPVRTGSGEVTVEGNVNGGVHTLSGDVYCNEN